MVNILQRYGKLGDRAAVEEAEHDKRWQLVLGTLQPSKRPLISPHANADAHERVMARLRRMTREERRQSLIDAGILEPNGELAEPHKSAGRRERSG